MSRWIVFDQPTADAVQSRSGIRPEIWAEPPDAFVATLLNSPAAVAVVPAAEPGNVLLIRLRRSRPAQAPQKTPSNLAPAGFLGLSDTIDMDSEPEPPKKWWRKIIG